MRCCIIVGLFTFQVALYSLESNQVPEPSKGVQVSQDALGEEEEELIVFDDGDFTDDDDGL